MTNPQQMQQATNLLKACKHPLLIAHPRPDGDTIGSTLALRLALLALGKEPVVACVHPIPPTFAYLPGVETFVKDIDTSVNDSLDMVVAIDMSDLKRTGGIYRESWRGQLPLLVIDHHETNDAFGDVNLVEPAAAATALPMMELIQTMGVTVNASIATCLLTAIMTDTRGLRTETTSPAVLSFVARLIEAGGDYSTVVQKSLDSVPYQQMRAWGMALNHLQLDDGVAWTHLSVQEKRSLDLEDHDDLSLSNFLSRIAEAKILVAFLEMQDDTVKISMRARPGYNVAWIAKELGGGGHRQAAGCTISGTLKDVQARVLPYVHEEIKRSAP